MSGMTRAPSPSSRCSADARRWATGRRRRQGRRLGHREREPVRPSTPEGARQIRSSACARTARTSPTHSATQRRHLVGVPASRGNGAARRRPRRRACPKCSPPAAREPRRPSSRRSSGTPPSQFARCMRDHGDRHAGSRVGGKGGRTFQARRPSGGRASGSERRRLPGRRRGVPALPGDGGEAGASTQAECGRASPRVGGGGGGGGGRGGWSPLSVAVFAVAPWLLLGPARAEGARGRTSRRGRPFGRPPWIGGTWSSARTFEGALGFADERARCPERTRGDDHMARGRAATLPARSDAAVRSTRARRSWVLFGADPEYRGVVPGAPREWDVRQLQRNLLALGLRLRRSRSTGEFDGRHRRAVRDGRRTSGLTADRRRRGAGDVSPEGVRRDGRAQRSRWDSSRAPGRRWPRPRRSSGSSRSMSAPAWPPDLVAKRRARSRPGSPAGSTSTAAWRAVGAGCGGAIPRITDRRANGQVRSACSATSRPSWTRPRWSVDVRDPRAQAATSSRCPVDGAARELAERRLRARGRRRHVDAPGRRSTGEFADEVGARARETGSRGPRGGPRREGALAIDVPRPRRRLEGVPGRRRGARRRVARRHAGRAGRRRRAVRVGQVDAAARRWARSTARPAARCAIAGVDVATLSDSRAVGAARAAHRLRLPAVLPARRHERARQRRRRAAVRGHAGARAPAAAPPRRWSGSGWGTG